MDFNIGALILLFLNNSQIVTFHTFSDNGRMQEVITNPISFSLFLQMRSTRGVSIWPVGFVGGRAYERPLVSGGKVVGWYTGWRPDRPFATDMAGKRQSVNQLSARITWSDRNIKSFCQGLNSLHIHVPTSREIYGSGLVFYIFSRKVAKGLDPFNEFGMDKMLV